MLLHGRALKSSRGRSLGNGWAKWTLCGAFLRLHLPSSFTLHGWARQGPTNHIPFTLHFGRDACEVCGCRGPDSGLMISLCHFSETNANAITVFTYLYRYIFTANG